MASDLHDDGRTTAQALRRHAPEPETGDPGFRTEARELIAKLQQGAPDDYPTMPPGPRVPPRTPARTFGVLDAREVRHRPADAWPRWMVHTAEVAALMALMAGAVYGPPYYTCRQMKERGLFYYGTTIGSCVQDRVSARYDAVEAYVQRVTRGL